MTDLTGWASSHDPYTEIEVLYSRKVGYMMLDTQYDKRVIRSIKELREGADITPGKQGFGYTPDKLIRRRYKLRGVIIKEVLTTVSSIRILQRLLTQSLLGDKDAKLVSSNGYYALVTMNHLVSLDSSSYEDLFNREETVELVAENSEQSVYTTVKAGSLKSPDTMLQEIESLNRFYYV